MQFILLLDSYLIQLSTYTYIQSTPARDTISVLKKRDKASVTDNFFAFVRPIIFTQLLNSQLKL